MIAAPPIVLPLFATPLGIVTVPEADNLNPQLVDLFTDRASQERTSKGRAPHSNGPVYRSHDDLFDRPEQPARALSTEIFRGVCAVVETLNAFEPGQLLSFSLEARGWFTIIEQHGSLPAASYPLTAWCAMYCVAAPEPSATRQDSGVLRLYESRLGTMFQDATNSVMRVPFTSGHYAWRPVAGQLAVFPASLTHEIALLKSAGRLILVTARVRFVAPGQQGIGRW
jgi:hypothetical protein